MPDAHDFEGREGAPSAASPGREPSAEPELSSATEPPAPAFDFLSDLRNQGRPMSADEVAERAAQVSPRMEAAKAAVEGAQVAAQQARLAVWPRLDLEARYTRRSQNRTTFDFVTEMRDPTTGDAVEVRNSATTIPRLPNQGLLEASLVYPVSDLFFEVWPRYQARTEAVKAEQLRAAAEARVVRLSAREAYYDYARALASLMIAESGTAALEAQHEEVRTLVKGGRLPQVELVRAEAQVARSKGTEARARGAVARARASLTTLLQMPGESIAVTDDFSENLPEVAETSEALVERALQTRSELKSLETLSRVHERLARAHEAGKWPTLSLGAGGTFANPNQVNSPWQNEWTGSWFALASLTWSPHDWAESKTAAAASRADLARTLADLASLENAIRTEVLSAYEDHVAALAVMEAVALEIPAAEEAYRVRRSQLKGGAALVSDVIQAETDLRRARLSLIDAAIDMRVARARLRHAVEDASLGQ